jgi:hypothetical protein
MRGRLAAGVVGTGLVLLAWAAGRGGDGPDALPITTTTSGPTTTVGPGHIQLSLADDDPETPDEAWSVDLATATGTARSGICGPSGSFHLAVVDRTATPLRGLRLSTVTPWAGPGSATVTGQLLPAQGDPVDVTGTLDVRVDGVAVSGDLDLRDDAGTDWTGTFSCGG